MANRPPKPGESLESFSKNKSLEGVSAPALEKRRHDWIDALKQHAHFRIARRCTGRVFSFLGAEETAPVKLRFDPHARAFEIDGAPPEECELALRGFEDAAVACMRITIPPGADDHVVLRPVVRPRAAPIRIAGTIGLPTDSSRLVNQVVFRRLDAAQEDLRAGIELDGGCDLRTKPPAATRSRGGRSRHVPESLTRRRSSPVSARCCRRCRSRPAARTNGRPAPDRRARRRARGCGGCRSRSPGARPHRSCWCPLSNS